MTQQLADFLDTAGLSQRELAARLGVTEEHVSRVINGKQPVTGSFIGKFFIAFGSEATERVFGQAQDAAQ